MSTRPGNSTPQMKKTQSGVSVASSNPAATPPSFSMSESRKRQSKKDDAIRRKIELEMKKRKSPIKSSRQSKKQQPGSILSLKPSDPVTCKPSISITEAAQLMSAKRENCILVVGEDDEEELLGIFTAKDLAFRVVGAGLDSRRTTIQQIMTPNPTCAGWDTSASDALGLMVSKGFRHLPVLDEEGKLFGVLDITKCYQEAMEKLERVYDNSKKLYEAFDSVNTDLSVNHVTDQPYQIVQYFETMKKLMEGPTLEHVLDGKPPVYVGVRTSVYEAATLMRENRTTAVLVREQQDITGIFTSKDVVLRVIAASLDPKTCSVIRVMTPQPDFASKSTSIQAALRKMQMGHYLNLPVVDDDEGAEGEVIGVVEVLKLTYATLNQIKNMQDTSLTASNTTGSVADADDNQSSGPAWNRFWNSLENDSDSLHSGSNVNTRDGIFSPPPDVSQSEIAQFTSGNELEPDDSASFVNENSSRLRKAGNSNGRSNLANEMNVPLHDVPYPFKFKSPSGRVHRITIVPSSGYLSLRNAIKDRLLANELEELGGPGIYEILENEEVQKDDESNDILKDSSEVGSSVVAGLTTLPRFKVVEHGFAISYIDDDNDLVSITSNQDLIDAVIISRKQNLEKAELIIHHYGEAVDNLIASANESMKGTKNNRANKGKNAGRSNSSQADIIPGVPNELLLPSSCLVLAASVLLVFAMSRRS